MGVRAIRGAITVKENERDEILQATRRMLEQIVQQNSLKEDDIISAIFTTTRDLNAAFPAEAARQMGWKYPALMCSNEMEVPGSLRKCIRVLLHVNTDMPADKIRHVYLEEARSLRPDLCS